MSDIKAKTKYLAITATLAMSLGYTAGLVSAGVSEIDAQEIQRTHVVSSYLDVEAATCFEGCMVAQCTAVRDAFGGDACSVKDFRASPGVCQYYSQNTERPDEWELRVSVTKTQTVVPVK